ncbi:MAG: pyruvate kinase [Mariprofundaceae bacterium]|nr:pyruvate kinase [Mariprofundaceae bacterium]
MNHANNLKHTHHDAENNSPLKKRRTKIIVTMGPAIDSVEAIQSLLRIGVNVFRLNMSHGDHKTHERYYQMIRNQAYCRECHTTIMADLCGPKIRCGMFQDGGITLTKGKTITITTRNVEGRAGLIASQYTALHKDVSVGQRILLADGVMQLRVLECDGYDVLCRIEAGGVLTNHKGINLPDSTVSAPALTKKDLLDADFSAALGVDFLALSFVRTADDVLELRRYLNQRDVGIIAKIERPEAVENAADIVRVADGIMVARGDLGVEIPAEQVPLAQQMLIDTARSMDKPVIVATQMLESMIEHARATRAEVTDVFHSVTDGTDAVMLSAETAAGQYPLEAASTMDRIVRYAETCLWQQSAFRGLSTRKNPLPPLTFGDAVARAMAGLSCDLMVRAIVVFSPTGVTAKAMAAARPEAPMLVVSTSPNICRRLNLLWGVIPVLVDADEMTEPCVLAGKLALRFGLAMQGESILLVQGFHKDHALNHPSITVICV